MTKLAIFGDSYLARLGKSCNYKMNVPGDVRFFCAGGMRADTVFTEARFREQLDQLIEFQPQVVFINLGGNAIHSSSTPADILRNITVLVDTLRENGGQTVYYQKIGQRGKFRGTITGEHFERQRRAVNMKPMNMFKETFVKVRIYFPQHFDEDMVHYSTTYFHGVRHGVRRVLLKHKSRV